jgi:methionyl aminopeptidase
MMLSQIKKQSEIEAMRAAGAVLATGLRAMKEAADVGISTQELSDLAAEHIKNAGMKPAFLNYPGSGGAPPYPDVACISVNDAVVHGMPSEKIILKHGDIVSLDLGVVYEDMIVDGAITAIVGQTGEREKELVETTRKALSIGLKQVKDGCFTGDIGQAVQEVLQSKNLGVVRDLVGHGVGYSIHEDPNIPNFGKKGTGSPLKSGMTVAIEPMATLGRHEVYIDKDGWTVRTRDGSRAAHFEHTILVTQNGYEILTA